MRPGEEETNIWFPNIPFHTCILNGLIQKVWIGLVWSFFPLKLFKSPIWAITRMIIPIGVYYYLELYTTIMLT